MNLEEYIAKRKKEDKINEFNLERRVENTKICVNYVFEYFNNYLTSELMNEKTIVSRDKIEKYRKLLGDYDSEVREWLVSMYAYHGKYMHRQLMNFVVDEYFLLYDDEKEFTKLSQEIYKDAVKRFPFLQGQENMVYKWLNEFHKMGSSICDKYYISEDINAWIQDTYKRYGVNIYAFCSEWVVYFYENIELWPKEHKRKSKYYEEREKYREIGAKESIFWDYDYKQRNNLFGIDSLYRNMPKKEFMIEKKQELEAVLLYCWLHSIESDEEYWDEYCRVVLG